MDRYALSLTLAFVSFAASAQQNGDNSSPGESNTAPKPKVQSDLNTFQLASAHRERAASVDERTNGLWQSWVVAICQGCGVREREYSQEDVDDLIRRAAASGKDAPAFGGKAAKTPAPMRRVSPLNTMENRGPALTTGSIGRR